MGHGFSLYYNHPLPMIMFSLFTSQQLETPAPVILDLAMVDLSISSPLGTVIS